jgi:serine/threonine protein kinase
MLLHQMLSLLTCRAAGGELQTVLDAEEGLQEQYAARFMRQILEGLSHLHTNNIVHLDLKVRNELLLLLLFLLLLGTCAVGYAR